MSKYRVVHGLNYIPAGSKVREEVRREPGDIVTDLPPGAIEWLLEGGSISADLEPPVESEPAPDPEFVGPAAVADDSPAEPVSDPAPADPPEEG